jgi:hypothetical protein
VERVSLRAIMDIRARGAKGELMARQSQVVGVVLGIVVIGAWDVGTQSGSDRASAPRAVNCADAPRLRRQALEDRRRSVETRGDQEKILALSRATFYASLATIADLKCKVTLDEADEALKIVFGAARKAEATSGFYEGAGYWGEAGFLATQVVSMLMKELSAPQK